MFKLGEVKTISISKWVKPETHVLDIASKKPVTCRLDNKLKDVLHLFAKSYRRMPVLNKEGHVRGMLSATDLLNVLGGCGKYRRIKPADRTSTRAMRMMSPHVFHFDKNVSLPTALASFKQHKAGAYPVMYRSRLVGIVTEWDIVRQMRGGTGVKVRDIMVRKPLVAQASHGISDVAKMLGMGGFRRLPVMNKGLLVGMVTPRDILRFLHANRLAGKLQDQGQPIKRIMEKDIVSIRQDQDVHDAVQIMIGRKIGGLPVMEDHQLLGIITERDVVDSLVF
jgi:CBS domain-containing protein